MKGLDKRRAGALGGDEAKWVMKIRTNKERRGSLGENIGVGSKLEAPQWGLPEEIIKSVEGHGCSLRTRGGLNG